MKTFLKVILIIAGTLVLLGGIIVAISFTFYKDFSFDLFQGKEVLANPNPSYTDVVQEFPAAEVESISIDEVHFDVSILQGEGNSIRVECKDSDDMLYEISLKGGKLKIEHKFRVKAFFINFSSFFSEKGTLTIYLPKDFELAGDLRINTVSAAVGMEWADDAFKIGGKLEIETTSGEITVSKLAAEKEAKIHSTSGRISLSSCSASKLKTENTSGRTAIIGCVFSKGNAELNSVSGSLSVENTTVQGTLSLGCVSGKTTVIGSQFGAFSCESVSGAVELAVLDGQYAFSFNTVSGSTHNTEPSYPNGIHVAISTVSGSIKIRANDN